MITNLKHWNSDMVSEQGLIQTIANLVSSIYCKTSDKLTFMEDYFVRSHVCKEVGSNVGLNLIYLKSRCVFRKGFHQNIAIFIAF